MSVEYNPSSPLISSRKDAERYATFGSVNSDKLEHPKTNRSCSRYWGLFLVVVSSLFMSFMSVCAKYLADQRVPAFEVALARMTVQFLVTSSLISSSRCITHNYVEKARFDCFPQGKTKWLLLLSGLCYVGTISGFQMSLMLLNLSKATVIYFTMPMWTALLSWCLIKEQLSYGQKFAIILTVAGTFLVGENGISAMMHSNHSTQSGQELLGITICLAGAILGGLWAIVVRHVVDESHPYVFCWHSGLVGIFVLPVLTALFEGFQNPDKTHLILMALIGCGFFTSMSTLFSNTGLKYESATIVSVVRTTDILFNIFWDIVLFGQTVGIFVWSGAILIILACVVIALEKQWSSKEASDVDNRKLDIRASLSSSMKKTSVVVAS